MQGRQKTAFTFVNIQVSAFHVQVVQYDLVMSNPVILYVGGKFLLNNPTLAFQLAQLLRMAVFYSDRTDKPLLPPVVLHR